MVSFDVRTVARYRMRRLNETVRPLSILMACPQYHPLTGGTERQAEKLSSALVRAGHKVSIVTPRLVQDSPKWEVSNGVEIHRFQYDDLSARIPLRGIGAINLPYLDAQIARALGPHLQAADVVHIHSGGLFGALVCKAVTRANRPSICKIAISQPSELVSVRSIPLFGRNLYSRFVDENRAWIAISADIVHELRGLGVPPERIHQIPNGVRIPEQRIDVTEIRNILYLGRLSSNINRDIPTLLHAFQALVSSGRKLKMALVGDGDQREYAIQLADSLGVGEQVIVPGLDRPEAWLDWADVFVLPSRREGLSNALLEAMAHGIPCIANDIPSNREALQDGEAGYLTPVGDKESLAGLLTYLIDNPVKAIEMGLAGAARARKEYGIDEVASRLVDVYQSVMDEPK